MDTVRQQMAKDDGQSGWDEWLEARRVEPESALEACQQRIGAWMDADAKVTGLKSLQGLIWESGFASGQLRSHVYPDVLPAINAWRKQGLDVRIYSSGSIAAQKLFFGHVADHGNVLNLFSGHYDTTIGSKREAGQLSQARRRLGFGSRADSLRQRFRTRVGRRQRRRSTRRGQHTPRQRASINRSHLAKSQRILARQPTGASPG